MSFLSMVLAVLVGLLVWDALCVLIKFVRNKLDEKLEDKQVSNTRKIGFEGGENNEEANNGVKMRRIGFGAND